MKPANKSTETSKHEPGVAIRQESSVTSPAIYGPVQRLSRRRVLKGSAALTITAGLGAMAASIRPAETQSLALTGRDLLVDKRPVLHEGGSGFGVYDPYGDFSSDSGLATEHLFLPWEDVDLTDIARSDRYARERGRKIMVTVEPWSWSFDKQFNPTELRDLILSGQRDANMRAILNAVADFRSGPLIIRWAQEMDSDSGHFVWQFWTAQDYIAAYRRMAAITREILPDAKLMWSPRGDAGLDAYYPGDDVVDLVGLSVFGYQEYDQIEYDKPQTFAEILGRGYDRVVGYGKPIWVAELGYEGDLPYLTSWADDVTRRYDQFPMLEEVVYFNDQEVYPWPHDLGLPNWRVMRDLPTMPVRA